MKYLLFFLLPCFLYGQSNPDGEVGYPSFHFTPLYYTGSYELNTVGNNWNYNTGSAKVGTGTTKPKFSFEALIKYPVSEQFTLSCFYKMNNYTQSEVYTTDLFVNSDTKAKESVIGLTISFYTKKSR